MPAFIDLTGKKFGSLTVIQRANDKKGSKATKWLCQCSCGDADCLGTTVVVAAALKIGATKSCNIVGKRKTLPNFINSTHKVCTRCKTGKLKSEFHKDKQKSDGLHSLCKECKRKDMSNRYDPEQAKIDYMVNKEKVNEACKKYYQKNKSRLLAEKKVYKLENRDRVSEKQKEWRTNNVELIRLHKRNSTEKNRSKILKYGYNWRHSPETDKNIINSLLPEDRAEYVSGAVTVVCKTCGKRFTPLRKDVRKRIHSITHEHGLNLYCSDDCKTACPVFRFKSLKSVDPRSTLYQGKSEKESNRKCQTDHLKILQCDEVGHNYCEKCGDIIDVELHHTVPITKKGSVQSSGHILLCVGCHQVLHAECEG